MGGLPPNLRGWLRVTSMRLQAGDPFAVQSGHPAHPQLENLPERSGPRPKVAPHPVPHRVLDQHSPHELIDQLAAMFDGFAAMKRPALEYRTSGWEKHNKALFASTPATPHDPAQPTSGELGHFHPSDGSLHVILSPGDAYLVISNQWGELHPLAGRSLNLPPTYTLLYPARNQNELATIRTIVTAAIDNMTGT